MRRSVLVLLAMVCLQAQVPMDRFTWKPLLAVQASGVDLRYCTVITGEGLALQFRNFGTQDIHFDFYLPGLQTPDQSVTQGRIHVNRGHRGGPMLIPGLASATTTPTLIRVRLGGDTGSYWRD